ncbi:hypothetical protein [Streptomyces fumanus]|uniref:hypothetical protein n=1 Tax=Streptomyces fumanus TaxID=67302 RepID=UPI0033E10E8F
MHPGRYHLLLTTADRPTAHGWWDDDAVARSKAGRWIGQYGRDDARITLTDEGTGETLTEWPQPG